MADFKLAYNVTAAIEGGYVNDTDDNGGETYKGVARNFWPNWLGWKIIDRIKARTTAKGDALALFVNKVGAADTDLQFAVYEFYRVNFWLINKLDQVANQNIANEAYDTGVNMGTTVAAKILQEALNLCNKNGVSYSDIVVDGVIGRATLNALASANTTAVFNTMNLLQGERYLNIMRAKKTQEKFWPGWLKRVILLVK